MPAEPIYSDFTEELYLSLPEVYREYDAQPEQNWAFKDYIASFGDCADPAEVLFNRFWFETQEWGGPGFVNGTLGNCDLANPARADESWLSWLAQVIGVSLRGLTGDTVEDITAKQRLWMSDPLEARRVGSEASLVQFGKAALTGTQHVEVFPRTTSAGVIGAAGEWDVALAFRGTEIYVGDPTTAVVAAGQKPAGWLLYPRIIENTWGEVKAGALTWGGVRSLGTWAEVQYDFI